MYVWDTEQKKSSLVKYSKIDTCNHKKVKKTNKK